MRSREKGASLFTMIPLERWNVERRDTDSRKSEKRKAGTASSRSPIRQLEHGGDDYVPPIWNAVEELNTLATAGTDHLGRKDASVFT
jgi:hypothetical protein